MKPSHARWSRFIVAATALIAVTLTGCQSVQLPTPTLPSLSATNVIDSVQSTFEGPQPNREIALASFAEAEKTFDAASTIKEGNREDVFRKAGKLYKRAAEHSPKTTTEEDALMMVAESHFFANEYDAAATAYDELIAKYPRTRHLDQIDQRRFATSQYWLQLTKKSTVTNWLPNFIDKQRPTTDTFGFATKNLDKIRFDNPTGKLADDATMAAAIANFEKHKFGQADMLFEDIRENFPSSEHQFQAHLLGLKCKQRLYRGPEYAGTVLDEGQKIIRQIFSQFPQQAEQHKVQLEEMHKDFRLKQAERDYSMAKYYDGRAEFGAAHMYYDNVKDEYQDTNLALEAEDRMTTISKLPPEPKEALGWLGNLFPKQQARTKPLFNRSSPGVAR